MSTRWLRELPAWGVSLALNAALLIAMNLIIFSTVGHRRLSTITSAVETEQPEELVFEATATDQIGTEGDASSLTQSLASAVQRAEETKPAVQEEIEQSLLPDVAVLTDPVPQIASDQLTEQFESRGASDVQGGGVEGVMDRLTFEIASSLKQNKTLVIWAFDASGSLDERRKAMVERFANVYEQLNSHGDTTGLYTAALAFGQETEFLTDQPVSDIGELKKSIEKIKTDTTGTENVFTAVGLATEKFKKFKRSEGPWNKLVFIVTDERGDDAELLESVVTEAKRYRFRCFVVGNAATFGQKKGYVPYVAPEDGETYYIPVDQGPETAFPERIGLAFWGGGDARAERMSAGFGPYALTRLCAETGGVYLVSEDGNRDRYDPAVMRLYSPDYRPATLIEADLSRNPAIKALVQAAARGLVEEVELPTRRFRADSDTELRRAATEAQRPLAVLDHELRGYHELLEAGEKGREVITDPRWEASFDLALGRVLAMRVRAYGYNAMLAAMKSSPKTFEKEGNNEWRIEPADEIATGPQVRKMAEQARELLTRVVERHAGTPWAALAKRELAQPFGWKWTEARNERYEVENGMQGEEARLLFEEEEERKREAKKKVVLPKL